MILHQCLCTTAILLITSVNNDSITAFQVTPSIIGLRESRSRSTNISLLPLHARSKGGGGNKTIILKQKKKKDDDDDSSKSKSSNVFGTMFNSPKISKDGEKSIQTTQADKNKGSIKTGKDVSNTSSLDLGSLFQFQKPKAVEKEVKIDTKPVEKNSRNNNLFSSSFFQSQKSNIETNVNESMNNADTKIIEKKMNNNNFFNAFGSPKTIENVTLPDNSSSDISNENTFDDVTVSTTPTINSDPPSKTKSKFTFFQRIESIKAGIVGLAAGGTALTPVSLVHNILLSDDSVRNGLAQWEFDTDTGSIASALFAIVYRYCVREGEETNEMLQMGVIGAFVLVRTLAKIRVPVYCSAAPLDCGEPLGYFDYSMIGQAINSGLESVVMFGVTALAIEFCHEKGYISRFK